MHQHCQVRVLQQPTDACSMQDYREAESILSLVAPLHALVRLSIHFNVRNHLIGLGTQVSPVHSLDLQQMMLRSGTGCDVLRLALVSCMS